MVLLCTDVGKKLCKRLTVSSLLPLFPDQAKSAAMIYHSLNEACVEHTNYGQIPVVAMDQPLDAVAKQIQ